MSLPIEIERSVIDDIKFGAVAVITKELQEAIVTQIDPVKWTPEDKKKYFLILDVQNEILERVRKTFDQYSKKK
jgi:hypothetical protein